MPTRTTQSTVNFASEFLLNGFDAPQPAGKYHIDREEETIEGVSWLAWRCVATFFHLPALGVVSLKRQMLQIDAADLEAALEKDHQ